MTPDPNPNVTDVTTCQKEIDRNEYEEARSLIADWGVKTFVAARVYAGHHQEDEDENIRIAKEEFAKVVADGPTFGEIYRRVILRGAEIIKEYDDKKN